MPSLDPSGARSLGAAELTARLAPDAGLDR
jgi:hypothetical protein